MNQTVIFFLGIHALKIFDLMSHFPDIFYFDLIELKLKKI